MASVSLQPSEKKAIEPTCDLQGRVDSDKSGKGKIILKWGLTGLPLVGVAWVSFLPLQVWMQQLLILFTLLWFYVFFLLDTFFLGG